MREIKFSRWVKVLGRVEAYLNLQYMFQHTNVFFSFTQYNLLIQLTIYKVKMMQKKYMVLCNLFPNISFTIKKLKFQSKLCEIIT